MGKFGTQVKVNNDMSQYVIGIVAPSGFGKSTLMKNVAEKLYGSEGYIAADFGQEDGYSAIDGAIVEKCSNWKHFKEMVDDIVKNKETDYPDLKVVIWDTLDAAFEVGEKFSVEAFNREHMGEPNFRKAVSINSCDGGFGNGLTRCINTVKAEIDRLKSVGVGFWYCAHCKERDQTDLFTGSTYTQLTASLTNKYFGSIQNISHIIGFGYFSRDMQRVEVGNENIVTKKKKTRDEITREERRIRFRDSDYVCAAKSRFSDIVPEINLSTDEFIEAIESAIKSASASGVPTKAKKLSKKAKEETLEEHVTITEDEAEELRDMGAVLLNDDELDDAEVETAPWDEDEDVDLFSDDESIDEEEPFDEVEAKATIRPAFKAADAETKKKVKELLAGAKLADVHDEKILKEILKALA